MQFIILSTLIISTFACSSVLYFDDTDTQILLIPDEAAEYHLEFIFNKNISYELGMINYDSKLQCSLIVDCSCPLNSKFDKSLVSRPTASYDKIYNGYGYKYNMITPSKCFKYQATPFADYTYKCDSSPCMKCGYKIKIITILVQDVENLDNLTLTINYTQINKYSEEELLNFYRFVCKCLDYKNPVFSSQDLASFGLIIMVIFLIIFLIIIPVLYRKIYKFCNSINHYNYEVIK